MHIIIIIGNGFETEHNEKIQFTPTHTTQVLIN